ncbi:sensor histidine kinase [Pedobacter sp. ASV12]|uniref:sensor histidine kinase n=1 Tax=Pedobacter sp. ASV12 TaxID=2795120 RepID=UPI0018EE37F8|nr:sensor histidine kinase [Pedobacter sp. ASV12]
MKRTQMILIHIGCWLLVLIYRYGAYLLKINSFYDAAFDVSMTILQLVEFYICFLWVYPRFLKQGKTVQLIGGILLSMGVFIGGRYLIEEIIYLHFFGFHNYADGVTFSYYILDNIYYSISYVFIALGIYSVQENYKGQLTQRKLKDEVVKAELAFLKSQINPHFLYNSLNYVYSLAIPVSEKLADAILRLSDLMRYTLNDSADGKVKLGKEVEYLESYIALFKMRFEPRFYVDFKTEGLDDEQQIASLVLIPFVENAFKHGVVNDEKHPVRIVLKVQPNRRLVFEVSNKINHSQKDHSSGVGLVNVYRRLDLIYPDRHELLVSNNGNTYKSTLIINL